MIDYQKYDVVVVGAGLSGAIAARYFADKGNKVLVVERRNHIAGNLYDYVDKKGNLVQKYGPHCFHTNNEEVFRFINKYSDWYNYTVKCDVYMNSQFTPSPFNFKTIEQYYEADKADILKKELLKEYPDKKSITIVELLDSKVPIIKEYAMFLFESDYSLYTAKQWGISPEDVDPEVLKRVPVLLNYDEQYFYDKYQVMPEKGFTSFIENILSNSNIDIVLNTDFVDYLQFNTETILLNGKEFKGKVIYTGEIDRLFNYKYGSLPYRSLRFEMKNEMTYSFQSAPIVAYPEAEGYTRITEYTKMPFQKNKWTSIAIEYPQEYIIGANEPYYPINNQCSNTIHKKYILEAKRFSNLYLLGRLAKYKYFNMDQDIDDVLKSLNKLDQVI